MKYQFILSYKATDSEDVLTNTCHPIYGDDLSVDISKESDEWYYNRKLDGKITFVNEDYSWIMAQAFDGTFTLTINESHDGGTTWHSYFESSFSRANLEIDEDNHAAVLSSFIEGVYNAIENGKDEDYDLMKLIPDAASKEVKGLVHPALVLVDYRQNNINKTDIFCGSAGTAGGYKEESGWSDYANESSDDSWNFLGVYAEAHVVMDDHTDERDGIYTGILQYRPVTYQGHTLTSIEGWLRNANNCQINVQSSISSANNISIFMYLFGSSGIGSYNGVIDLGTNSTGYCSPASLAYTEFVTDPVEKVEIFLHYIRATLLTQSQEGVQENVLDTGDYYKGMSAFVNDGGLQIFVSSRTVEQPNGHRLIPGTGEQGTTPQYFAPPDNNNDYIPLSEDNWNYGSLWYTIVPSVANGLTDPEKVGSFSWTRCWTIGTCLRYLLDKITDHKVVFNEDTTSSRFLYETINPVEGNEPFDYLVTQKSNVMRPSSRTGEQASRCPVRLQWFLELLRNGMNCYYWLEKQNDGRYFFRVEHVEYFRRGGQYVGDLPAQLDITAIYPRRNFRRNNVLFKRLSDGTNKYSYNLSNMVEKYTFSWQGDGGSDSFKGNPRVFRAGWIEKSSSESHEVDNIFADLDWLMLNAGSSVESSKNYDGLFLFGCYRPVASDNWKENSAPLSRYLVLGEGRVSVNCDLWLKAVYGQTITVEYDSGQTASVVATFTGTGSMQRLHVSYSTLSTGTLRVNFGTSYAMITLYRIHANSGNLYFVANTQDLLSPDPSNPNFLQNGPLAWPWLQCEYLHYDIPAQKWSYDSDDLDTATFNTNGTVKMVKKQTVSILPMPTADPQTNLGIKTGIGTGIIETAKINLSSRNCEMTLIYDPIPPQQ